MLPDDERRHRSREALLQHEVFERNVAGDLDAVVVGDGDGLPPEHDVGAVHEVRVAGFERDGVGEVCGSCHGDQRAV